ncbi:hypothetical protein BMD20_12595 [Burkholderia multivorans]|nr:hypothetical protein BMD20_12595 [Burkholderia multivorans]
MRPFTDYPVQRIHHQLVMLRLARRRLREDLHANEFRIRCDTDLGAAHGSAYEGSRSVAAMVNAVREVRIACSRPTDEIAVGIKGCITKPVPPAGLKICKSGVASVNACIEMADRDAFATQVLVPKGWYARLDECS